MPLFDGFESTLTEVDGCEIHARVGGEGPPVLLLHGYPQTHVCWHKVAPTLARHFTVVAADLRGYGDSGKPEGGGDHAAYSKARMAKDMIGLMERLGFERFMAAGHDRGGRVVQRIAQAHPEHVSRVAILDIIPMTLAPDMFQKVDSNFGRDTYHWFFLSQPCDLPERLIGADPEFFLRWTLESWGRREGWLSEEAFAEYIRTFRDPASIHATCEDYRAGVTADAEDGPAGRIAAPLLSLWGRESKFGRRFDPVAYWRTLCDEVSGVEVPGGHFIAEESPDEVAAALIDWFGR